MVTIRIRVVTNVKMRIKQMAAQIKKIDAVMVSMYGIAVGGFGITFLGLYQISLLL